MAVSFTSLPERPLPARKTQLTFTVGGSANYVRVYCTNAPEGSGLKKNLNESGASRVQVLEGDAGVPLDFTPDKPGAYLFDAEEINRGASSYRGGFEGSPAAYQTETIVGTTTGLTLRVGSRLTLPVGTVQDGASLVVYVWDQHVRATTVKNHGEISPALTSGTSDRAKAAALVPAVRSAVNALIDVSSSTIVGTLSTAITNAIDEFNDHLVIGVGVHAANDTDNTVGATYRNPTSPKAICQSVAELLRKYTRHILNDSGTGPDSAGYHVIGGKKAGDWANKIIAEDTATLDRAVIAFADFCRCYTAHHPSLTVHASGDGTNFLTASSLLITLHRAFLTEIAKSSATAPSTANAGAITLVSAAGAKES